VGRAVVAGRVADGSSIRITERGGELAIEDSAVV